MTTKADRLKSCPNCGLLFVSIGAHKPGESLICQFSSGLITEKEYLVRRGQRVAKPYGGKSRRTNIYGVEYYQPRLFPLPKKLPNYDAPLCECGCGERVVGHANGVWCRWKSGHTRRYVAA